MSGGEPHGNRPLIGVVGRPLAPGRVSRWPEPATAIQTTYLAAVQRAGGFAVTLDPVVPEEGEVEALLARLDGLVLTGGADVDPSCYGATPHPATYGADERSDAFELALTRASLDRDVPTLAICRGLQVLNVALGGTLDQHLPDRDGLLAHGIPAGGDPVMHAVALEPCSQLAAAMGVTRPVGASHHHQAIDRLGDGLVVTALADDGIVEGVELPGAWLLAVQWHPEDTAHEDPAQQALFDALVNRAAG